MLIAVWSAYSAGLSSVDMKIRWIGFSSRVFGATARIAPSVASAVLSAAITSRFGRVSFAIASAEPPSSSSA